MSASWEQEVNDLLGTNDTDTIVIGAARSVFALISPAVDEVSRHIDYVPRLGVDLLNRCIARRQKEAFDTILSLVASGKAYSATLFLRPMCEDLIFALWINQLDPSDADDFLVNRTAEEVLRGIKAQKLFFPTLRDDLGFDRDDPPADQIKILDEDISRIKSDSIVMGQRLGWGKRSTPSVRNMADATGHLRIYDFLYHASSASVHASPHHMFRMVWGNPSDGFNIDNAPLSQYYLRFALVYGGFLYAQHFTLLEALFSGEIGEVGEELDVWLALLLGPAARHSAPPIVTHQELRWNPAWKSM